MIKPWKCKRGQSIIEYLVVASLIIAAILAFRGTLNTKVGNLLTEAKKVVEKSATKNTAPTPIGLEVIEVGPN